MRIITIESDSTVQLFDGASGDRPVRQSEKTTVMITKNVDSATVTFGMKDSSGTFVAYPDGLIITGKVINHGAGIPVWVDVSGITSNAVEIEVSD